MIKIRIKIKSKSKRESQTRAARVPFSKRPASNAVQFSSGLR
jgi:hypothetical protein